MVYEPLYHALQKMVSIRVFHSRVLERYEMIIANLALVTCLVGYLPSQIQRVLVELLLTMIPVVFFLSFFLTKLVWRSQVSSPDLTVVVRC